MNGKVAEALVWSFFLKGEREQKLIYCFHRLKQASADSSNLTQDTIIENLDPVERNRLARIRNIGIAVSNCYGKGQEGQMLIDNRRISTVAKPLAQNVFFIIPAELPPFMKFEGKMPSEQRWTPWTWRERRVSLFNLRRLSATGRKWRTERRRNTTST